MMRERYLRPNGYGVPHGNSTSCHIEQMATETSDDAALSPGHGRCERFGIFPECPLCGGSLHSEHAHFKCRTCGWRDSCCD